MKRVSYAEDVEEAALVRGLLPVSDWGLSAVEAGSSKARVGSSTSSAV